MIRRDNQVTKEQSEQPDHSTAMKQIYLSYRTLYYLPVIYILLPVVSLLIMMFLRLSPDEEIYFPKSSISPEGATSGAYVRSGQV